MPPTQRWHGAATEALCRATKGSWQEELGWVHVLELCRLWGRARMALFWCASAASVACVEHPSHVPPRKQWCVICAAQLWARCCAQFVETECQAWRDWPRLEAFSRPRIITACCRTPGADNARRALISSLHASIPWALHHDQQAPQPECCKQLCSSHCFFTHCSFTPAAMYSRVLCCRLMACQTMVPSLCDANAAKDSCLESTSA